MRSFVSTELQLEPTRSPSLSYPRSRGLLLRTFHVSIFTILLGCIASATPGQNGSVKGVVSDPNGATLSEARITLRNEAGVVAYQARSDKDGNFAIDSVETGRYRVGVESDGFSQPQAIEIVIRQGQVESLSIKMAVAAVSDSVVVSATRNERPISELEESVSSLSSDLFQRQNQSLVSESLRQIPGLSVVQTGGRGGLTSVFIRGGESDYNKVLIDGVPVNAPGGAFDFSSLTTENLDRVEVARGPGSALFGSDAMTGVIQLITRRGDTATPEFDFSGEGGSFDFHRETTRLSGLTRWFDYSASFGFQSTDGRFRNSDYLNRSLSGNFGFRLSNSAQLRVTSRWNDNTLGVAGATAILFADPDQRQKHRDIAIGPAFEWRTTSKWYQSVRFTYSEFNSNSSDPVAQDLHDSATPPLPPGVFGDDFAFRFIDHEKRIGSQYQTIVALGRINVVTTGLDFEKESAVFTDDFSRVAPDRNNLGFYLQDQMAWRERLFVTAGVRVERNTANIPEDLRATLEGFGSAAPAGDVGFGLSANPRVATTIVVRRHRDDEAFGATKLRGSFGTGIKEPRLDEAFSPSPFFLGNPLLDPERVRSFDAGITQEFLKRRVSLELTYFDNRFRDQIAFVSDPVTFGPITLPDGRLANFVNLDRASARGVELIGAVRPNSRLSISGSYTFLSSEIEQSVGSSREVGLPLLRRPRHSGTIQASWVDSRFDVSMDGSFVGERRDIDPVTSARFDLLNRPIFNDGYALVNVSGSYRFNRFVTAFTRIGNLLNQDYQEILGFPAYRLNFSAGLRIRVGGAK